MRHFMHLNPSPFEKIKNGSKTIELRLYDEKRRKVKRGDEIEFAKIDWEEKLLVKVVNIYIFDSFENLYDVLPLDKCGYTKEKLPFAKAGDMESLYGKQAQQKWGVAGIEIEVI